MSNKNKSLLVVAGSVLVLALVAGAATLVTTSVANAQSSVFYRVGFKFTNLVHDSRTDGDDNLPEISRFPGKGPENDTYLADALGISIEELQAAQEKASAASMEAAIESGEITEEQAKIMEVRQALRGYIDQETLTAKALGITVEELQSAREEGKSPRDLMDELGISEEDFQTVMKAAYEAMIQQAVDDAAITQEQADLILNNDTNFGPGNHISPPGRGESGDMQWGGCAGFLGRRKNMDSYLADALGISVEELQSAREKASVAAMEVAIESGEITQEQANLMKAHQALRSYIDQEALTAKALGITVEKLKADREEGKSPRDLMDELGISQKDFQAAMKVAYEAAIQQAVKDGVITQEQAELILNSETHLGPGGPGGFYGSGNMEGQRGDFDQPGMNPPGMPGQNPPGSPNGFPDGPYSPTPDGGA